MKRFAILLACAAVAFGAQATPQQDKMKSCNAEAKGKKGDERKAFMKECLSAGAAASAPMADAAGAACEKSAADMKLHGAAAKSHVKKCMADAAAAPK
ncbi:PsiF family protein [Roseateles saccharophilus]|uniref:PsiF repeat-containing protein n=1 Tax=Roseateles saccharophilus TaxID=304 RepID=A0A4V2VT10_ROSSA|nr:phosphate starvation-inducible protein PsiF [Roseateles saccharophilus]TCV04360.1 psiF repeat-containing protein [Roseateles saccharophilus]